MEDTIKLPTSLALNVATQLRDEHGIDHWGKALFDSNFTVDELSKITSLTLQNPIKGCCEGIEYLPNLCSLSIKSTGSTEYKQTKDIASIGDEDIWAVEKCKNLKSLEITNQAHITDIDLSGMQKLESVDISRNNNLQSIKGIDKLPKLYSLTCYGNNSLQEIKSLDKAIAQGEELDKLNLDILLFPKAIDYRPNGSYNQNIINKMDESGVDIHWLEALGSNDNIKINHYQMLKMHNKACKILKENVPAVGGVVDTVVAVELYLAKNVTYDSESLDHGRTKTIEAGNNQRLITGIKNGTNGAFNCIMENSCVCEGYTRGEQYLLALRGIKTSNVGCIGEADTMGMSNNEKTDNMYSIYNLPDGGYHSIVRIDDCYNLYSDPCWNAGCYQEGDKSMPYSLLTKAEISKTHTLSFDEKNVNNEHFNVDRTNISESIKNNTLFKNKKASEISQQRNDTKPQIRGQITRNDEKTY